jgi:hypothetical protein
MARWLFPLQDLWQQDPPGGAGALARAGISGMTSACHAVPVVAAKHGSRRPGIAGHRKPARQMPRSA